MPKLLKLPAKEILDLNPVEAPTIEASLTILPKGEISTLPKKEIDPFVMLEPCFKRRPNRIVKDMPFDEYKRLPAINGSMLKFPTSYEMVDSLTDPDNGTYAKNFGSLCHTAILESHQFENGDWEKTYQVWTETAGLETKAALSHLKNDPRLLITVEMLEDAKRCRDAVWRHKEAARMLLEPGDCEVSGEIWDEDMQCQRKFRIDRLPHATSSRIIDLKSTRHRVSQLGKLKSQVYERGYHLQQANYLDQLAVIEGVRRPGASLIWFRNEKPFMCRVTDLDEDTPPDQSFLHDGRALYQERMAALVLGYVERNFEGYENEDQSPILTK